ncbi:hypothetical protein R83H12_02050 [Fibrobacteria bacterium R8-3-H12]
MSNKFSKLLENGKCNNIFNPDNNNNEVLKGNLIFNNSTCSIIAPDDAPIPPLVSNGWCVYDFGGGGFVIKLKIMIVFYQQMASPARQPVKERAGFYRIAHKVIYKR